MASGTVAQGKLVLAIPVPSQAARKRPAFVSPSVRSISISVSGIASPVIADVSATSTQCATTGSTRTCSIGVAAPVGNDTFSASAYAGADASGTLLGAGTALEMVVSGKPFSFSISVKGVTGSIRIVAAQVRFTQGVSTSTTLVVQALDAGGNVIDGAYDSAIDLTDSDTTGTFTISPTSLSDSATVVTLSYSGGTAASTATISARGANAPLTSVSAQVVTDGPSPTPSPTPKPTATPTAKPTATPTPPPSTITASNGCNEYTASGNLIVNPGAELGTGSASGNDIEPVPGWTTANDFTVVRYAASSSSFPASNNPGSPDRGVNFFSGGPDMAVSSATQTIAIVSSAAASIDAGAVSYGLCGWLGGYSSQDDNAVLALTFENANGALLGVAQIGPVVAADRNDVTSFLKRSTTGTIPIGTRQIVVTLTMTREEGEYNDGYADSLDFSMSTANGPKQNVRLGAVTRALVARKPFLTH